MQSGCRLQFGFFGLRLELPRRPEQRGQDHGGQTDDEAHDPAGDVLPHEYGAQGHSDTNDPAGGYQAHRAAFDLRATPLPARHHSLRRLVAARLTVPLASSGFELWLGRGRLVRR